MDGSSVFPYCTCISLSTYKENKGHFCQASNTFTQCMYTSGHAHAGVYYYSNEKAVPFSGELIITSHQIFRERHTKYLKALYKNILESTIHEQQFDILHEVNYLIHQQINQNLITTTAVCHNDKTCLKC